MRNDLNSTDYECLWIEINRGSIVQFLICCAYRAPDIHFTGFISNQESYMANITLDKSDFVLLGDLNANMLLHSRNKEKQPLLCMLTLGLTQLLIIEETRVN